MAKVLGRFMVLEQKQGEKAIYITLLDLDTKGQFQVSSPVLVDEKSVLVPLSLELEGFAVRKGVSKSGSPYTSISCSALKAVAGNKS